MKSKYSILFVISILILSACAKTELAEEVKSVVNVRTERAELLTYTPVAKYSGSVLANREANLGASIPGKVEKFIVNEGKNVKKGDLIVQMAGETLAQAEIEMKTLERDYNRLSRLKERGAVAEIDYDHLKAKYLATKEKYEMIKKSTEIRAPFDGMVVEYLLEEGENFLFNPSLAPGYSRSSGIVRLMQLNPVKILIDINEKELTKYQTGLAADIVFDALPGEVFKGKISDIKPILSHMTRTAQAEIIIENKDHIIKPGMFGRVTVNLEDKEALFIPRYAVIKQTGIGETFVFTVENNKAKRVVVQITDSVGDMVSVTGLKADDRVITAGKTNVLDGISVSITGGK